MPKYVDQHIRAHELFEQFGKGYEDIIKEVPVSVNTVRRWSKEENWEDQRREVITDPLSIALRVKRILSALVDEIEAKIDNKQFVAPTEVKKMLEYSQTIGYLNSKRDRRTDALFTMQHFTAWLYHGGEVDGVKFLHKVLPDYYRDLGNEG